MKRSDSLDYWALRVVRIGAQGVFCTWRNRHAEKYDRLQTLRDEWGKVWDNLVQTSAVLIR
jgi:hypothetical protein